MHSDVKKQYPACILSNAFFLVSMMIDATITEHSKACNSRQCVCDLQRVDWVWFGTVRTQNFLTFLYVNNKLHVWAKQMKGGHYTHAKLDKDQSWKELFVLRTAEARGLHGRDMFARALFIHTAAHSAVG